MKVANFTEFRTKLKQYLDKVEHNHETLIIKRGSGNETVLISLDEYNSILRRSIGSVPKPMPIANLNPFVR